MTPERFRKIEELYQAALAGTPEERAALLAQTDPELRREVELLLDARSSPEASTVTRLAVDTSLGPYRIESKLGEGGMGEVFRAVDTRLGRPVAIKFAHAKFNARFEREARAIAALNHPHICTLYDIGPNYLVMELLDGETIAARLKNGPIPVEEAARYASQIASALAEAHARGIVHRDLKPGNIMLVKSGVKVLDFGLATWEGDDTITGSNMVIGTPAYMAPEQRMGKPSDVRTDIYSFGCILYEMLSGERATGERKPLPSKSLERIVGRCLKWDPARRWQSSVELAREMEGAPTAGTNRRWGGFGAAIFVAGLAVALLAAYFVYFRGKPKLTDKDIVVLADFVNQTGDPIFDGTLRQGLAIQLEQSPFLKIMEDEQAQRVVRMMNLPAGARITNQVAHEICVREGAASTIDGAIASLGKSYVITVQAVACQNGATLAREQVQAQDKEHVLNAVGSAATAMRGKLGESLDSIQKMSVPLEEATTSSLEALQHYTRGFSEMGHGRFLPAVSFYERAIAIDPKFAMAYYYLAVASDNAGDIPTAAKYAEKAFGLVDRVTEMERDQILSVYYQFSTGEIDKTANAYQSSIRNYPRWWGSHNNLSALYIDLGQYEEALKEGVEATRLDPNVEPPYRRQLDAYLCMGMLADAKALAEKLRAKGLGGARIHQRFLEIAYVENDQAAIARETQWFAGKPGEYIGLGLQAASLNVHGERAKSHKFYVLAKENALRQGLANAASEFEQADARADALLGNCERARGLGRPALALAICGDGEGAKKIAGETSKLFPHGTLWNAVGLPEILAASALYRNQPAESVERLLPAKTYERAYLEVNYLRGLAYLRQNNGAAAGEFLKVVENKGTNWGAGWRYPYQAQFYSLSYLYLARAYKMEKDVAKAKQAYDAFFELWKDPDPEIRIYKDARAEYAKL